MEKLEELIDAVGARANMKKLKELMTATGEDPVNSKTTRARWALLMKQRNI
jgi:hypothetical protein